MDKNEARERGGGGRGGGGGGGKRMKNEEFCPTKSQMLQGTVSIPMLNTTVYPHVRIPTTCIVKTFRRLPL